MILWVSRGAEHLCVCWGVTLSDAPVGAVRLADRRGRECRWRGQRQGGQPEATLMVPARDSTA